MNPSSDIQALMALDALGETTPEQRAELRQHLAAHPELARTHTAASELALDLEIASILENPPAPQPISARTRTALDAARGKAIANATAAKARAGGAGNVVAFTPGAVTGGSSQGSGQSREVKTRKPNILLNTLAWAAVLTLVAMPVGWWLSQRPGGSGPEPAIAAATASPAMAPRGVTGMTQPTIVWENTPGQDYDVWILPGDAQQDAPAIFVANNVRSPIAFSQFKAGPANTEKAPELKPGKPYLALVCLAGKGRMAGVTVLFETAPAALGTPPAPSDAVTALSLIRQLDAAGRASDALMVIAGLPESVRSAPEIAGMEAELRGRLKK